MIDISTAGEARLAGADPAGSDFLACLVAAFREGTGAFLLLSRDFFCFLKGFRGFSKLVEDKALPASPRESSRLRKCFFAIFLMVVPSKASTRIRFMVASNDVACAKAGDVRKEER